MLNEIESTDSLKHFNRGVRNYMANGKFSTKNVSVAYYYFDIPNLTPSFSTEICDNRIDQGVGLIKKNSLNKKYYVIGVSVKESPIYLTNCYKNNNFAAFARVFDYIDFISEKTGLYSTIERHKFQISCGVKSVQAQTLIVGGNASPKGDYPWQVAVYRISDSQKTLICGGSLINQRIILTAAHCVTNQYGTLHPKENFIIAVGKYYRNFDDPRDNETSQLSALKEIIVSSQYQGWMQNHLGDIAILISETSFNISKKIQPICLDWESKYESEFLTPNTTGFVAGWGFTQENQNVSEELRSLEVPYVDRAQCESELPTDYKIYLTDDKLCAGFLNKGKSVCGGDSGGGLVFKNKKNDRYYLAGIVSLAPKAPAGGCNSQQYTLYTRVSKYIKNFILETAILYWN